MTKPITPGMGMASRRSVLRGSLIAAGAVAVGGGATTARAARGPMPMLPRVSERLIQIQAEDVAAAPPADLTGYTRVRQELVAPPFAPVHEQVATGGPKIIEVYMETTERLMTVDADTCTEIWALTF